MVGPAERRVQPAGGRLATRPITGNGFIRVLSNPAYGLADSRPEALLRRLATFRGSGHHAFWADDVSLADARCFALPFLGGHRQVTDVYLLGLAHAHGGCLATFDRTIPIKAVIGATAESLAVIRP